MSGTMADRIPVRDLQRLQTMTLSWGRDPMRVQGPGGNVSIKSGNLLRIKASGIRMDGARQDSAWADVDIGKFLGSWQPSAGPGRALSRDYEAYTRAIGISALPGARPSMETGFHAALPWTWIAHLHSVAGILMAALPASDARVREALEPVRQAGFAAVRIPPAVPGAALTRGVFRGAMAVPRGAVGGVLVLARCHGTIWAGDEADLLAATEDAFETGARLVLGLDRFPAPAVFRAPDGTITLDFEAWPGFVWQDEPAFPDMAVFHPDAGSWPLPVGRTLTLAPGPGIRDRAEIVSAQALLATAGAMMGRRIALPAAVARRTVGLELERMRLAQQKVETA
jgi:hypothetical protein